MLGAVKWQGEYQQTVVIQPFGQCDDCTLEVLNDGSPWKLRNGPSVARAVYYFDTILADQLGIADLTIRTIWYLGSLLLPLPKPAIRFSKR